jgi:hypothetical protein
VLTDARLLFPHLPILPAPMVNRGGHISDPPSLPGTKASPLGLPVVPMGRVGGWGNV